jgi:hypothetical protein
MTASASAARPLSQAHSEFMQAWQATTWVFAGVDVDNQYIAMCTYPRVFGKKNGNSSRPVGVKEHLHDIKEDIVPQLSARMDILMTGEHGNAWLSEMTRRKVAICLITRCLTNDVGSFRVNMLKCLKS